MMQPTKRKNPTNNCAKELKDRKYHQRIIKSKKIYDRKKDSNTCKR